MICICCTCYTFSLWVFSFRSIPVYLKSPPDSQYFTLRKYNHIEGHMKVVSALIYLFCLLLRLHYHPGMKWCFTEDYCVSLYRSTLCRKYGISLQAGSYFYRECKIYFPFGHLQWGGVCVFRVFLFSFFFFFLSENQLVNRKLLL